MRIISCYIKKFGAFQNKTIGFNEGLNCFTRQNGWGKSTLCAFIKAMFYGMEKISRSDFTDREKYLSFGDNVCGGNLIFEKGGKTYRIERYFYEKSKDDEFVLYDEKAQVPCGDFTSNIGEELFGLDMDSFERTLFICGDKTHLPKNTTSISSHINGLLENSDDLNSYDEICSRMEKDIQSLKSQRGSSSNRVIDRLEMEIREIETELLECTEHAKHQKTLKTELSALENTILQKEEAIKDIEKKVLERERLEKVLKDGLNFLLLSIFFILVFLFGVYAALVLFKKPEIIIVLAMLLVLALLNFVILGVQKKNIGEQLENIPGFEDLLASKNNLQSEKDRFLVRQGELKKEIESLEEKTEKIDTLENEKNWKLSEKDAAVEKLRILSLTLDVIKEAKNELDESYTKNVQKLFRENMKFLEEEREFFVNKDFEILEENSGSLMPFKYFSEGYKDLMAFCARLSLAECIFEDAIPFLILDDPFTSLDEEKYQRVMKLVEKTASKSQVFYFKAR